MRLYYRAFTLLACLSLLVFTQQSHASPIVHSAGQSNQVKLQQTSDKTTDLLSIQPTNKHGISVTRFSSFNVNRPLKIMNVRSKVPDPTKKGTFKDNPSAAIIVIVANQININSQVEILGDLADLVFVSTSPTGQITCTGCTVNNVFRVGFIVAQLMDDESSSTLTLNNNIARLGNLQSEPDGQVTINGLSAPGSIGVNILAGKLNLDGDIKTHERISVLADGGYKKDPDGNKTLAAASFSAMLGDVIWDFEEQELRRWESTPGKDTLSSLNGAIESSAVKITATYPLTVNTNIDTRADLRASVRYHNRNNTTKKLGYNNYIADEIVHIHTLQATKKADNQNLMLSDSEIGETIFNGNILSTGVIAINSMGHLSAPNSATKLDAEKIELIANRNLFNDADIKAFNIGVAANDVINRGKIQALKDLEGFAQVNFRNEFGGEIYGVKIDLRAANGFVRNGSRTPYITTGSENTNLLTYSTSDLNAPDPIELGTFYKNGVNININSTNKKAPHTHAFIVGKNVSISAKGVENINAYWEQVTDQESHELNLKYANQVSIAAEQELLMNGSDYILNSSAVIAVRNASGVLSLKANAIVNERYRILSILDRNIGVKTIDTDPKNYTHLSGASILARMEKYSPQGLISSLGYFRAEALHGILNSGSYIDIYRDALMYTNKFGYYGVASSGYTNGILASYDLTCIGKSECNPVKSIKEGLHKIEPKELSALFSVQGDFSTFKFFYEGDQIIKKVDSNGEYIRPIPKIEKFNAFDKFLKDLANKLTEDIYVGTKSKQISRGPNGTKITYVTDIYSEELTSYLKPEVNFIFEDNRILVNQAIKTQDKYSEVDTTSYPGLIMFTGKATYGESSLEVKNQKDLSLWKELENFYQSIKDKFKALIDEFNFWS